MTEREAIEYLRELLEELAEEEMPRDYDRFFDSTLLAIAALEEQIAKKPVVESYFELLRNGKALVASCPTCGEGLTYFDNLGMKKNE